MSKVITVSASDHFEIRGNTSLEAASATLEGRKRVTILDGYKSVDKSTWISIVSACFNDAATTEENRAARYWRSSARKWAKISGIPAVVDFLFAEEKVHSLDTLARTYCPALYAKVRGK